MEKQITQKQIEIEKLKISLTNLIKERKMNSTNGYLGIKLNEGRGIYNEKQIMDMWVEGDNVVILTDNYKFRKPVSSITKHITW